MIQLPWFLLNPKDAKEVYRREDVSYLVLDVEAEGPNKAAPVNPKSDLILACWTVVHPGQPPVTKYCWGDEFSMGPLLEDLKQVSFMVAHHAKYEMQWLKRCGVELRDLLCWCTSLSQWVLDGNRTKPRDLGSLCVDYQVSCKWDLIKLLWETGVTTSEIPPSWLLEYCLQDVTSTFEIFLKQRELIYERNQQHLAFQRALTAACLADIEFNGMHLDKDRVEAELARVLTGLQRAEEELREVSGGINLNSGKQLAELLYDKLGFAIPKDSRGKEMTTGGGARPTSSAALSLLVCKTDTQRDFVRVYQEYNRLDSLYSKSLAFFKGVCDHEGGMFNGVFNQGIAQTHRLTSSGVPLLFPGNKKPMRAQFQNQPREYKRLFWSGDEEYFLGEADGSQLEFRVAADLGDDAVAYKEICDKEDIHSITAKALTDAGEPTSRQEAKSRTFRPLYGGQSGTKAEQEYIKFFTEKYKGISGTQRGWAMRVLNDKKLRTPYGMEFFWPDTSMGRGGYISNTTSIYNYPIQGFATAEIIPIALVFFWQLTKDLPIFIVNTVHDSIISKVYKDAVAVYKELSIRCFTTEVYKFLKDVYDYQFKVPLGTGLKVSRNWSDTKNETSVDVYPDGTTFIKEK